RLDLRLAVDGPREQDVAALGELLLELERPAGGALRCEPLALRAAVLAVGLRALQTAVRLQEEAGAALLGRHVGAALDANERDLHARDPILVGRRAVEPLQLLRLDLALQSLDVRVRLVVRRRRRRRGLSRQHLVAAREGPEVALRDRAEVDRARRGEAGQGRAESGRARRGPERLRRGARSVRSRR